MKSKRNGHLNQTGQAGPIRNQTLRILGSTTFEKKKVTDLLGVRKYHVGCLTLKYPWPTTEWKDGSKHDGAQ